MILLRQLMILALVPVTAWSGMPHVACRCSNGEVHLFCPRLNEAQAATEPTAARQKLADSSSCCKSPKNASSKSGCGSTEGGTCCGSQSSGSNDQGAGCCAAGCHCTAVYISFETGPTLKKVSVPELTQFVLAAAPVSVIRLPRVTRVDLGSAETAPRVPDDLIVLYERWLI